MARSLATTPLTGEGVNFSEIMSRSYYLQADTAETLQVIQATSSDIIHQASDALAYLADLQGMVDALEPDSRAEAQAELDALRPLAIAGQLDVASIRGMIRDRADFTALRKVEALARKAEEEAAKEAERQRRHARDEQWNSTIENTMAMIDRAEREGRITGDEARGLRETVTQIDVGQREIYRLDDTIKDAPPGTDTTELETQRTAAIARQRARLDGWQEQPVVTSLATNDSERDALSLLTAASAPSPATVNGQVAAVGGDNAITTDTSLLEAALNSASVEPPATDPVEVTLASLDGPKVISTVVQPTTALEVSAKA